MSKITWLHLSDLHFRKGEKHSWDENIVLRALLVDVQEQIMTSALRPDFAIVSGDIAFQGAADEYALARQFFDDLLKAIDLPKSRLFIVPGNHDVNRQAITRGAATIASSLDNRQAVEEVLTVAADRSLIFRKFDHYASFVNDYFEGTLAFDDEHYFYVHCFGLANRRVAVLGLNSAWLAMSDKDRNQLLLGERQVRTALTAARDADLRLAVMHHPFDWLQDFDRYDVESLLCNGCHFVLHGHMHQTGLLQVRTPDTEAMLIAAGACYETRQYPNSYNFVQLDFSAGRGTTHLRMYSDRRGGFWSKDVLNYHNVKDGSYTFKLSPELSAITPLTESQFELPTTSVQPTANPAQLEEAYLRRILVLENVLPLAAIDPRAIARTRQQTMDLLAVYVALDTQTSVTTEDTEGAEERQQRGRRQHHKTRFLTALEAANQERQMVLLGDLGSGKSTFVNYMALCLAGARLEWLGGASVLPDNSWLAHLEPTWNHGPLFPLQITLRHFAKSNWCDGTSAGLWSFVVDLLVSQGLADFAPHLRQRLLDGEAVVLLDGLDEVVDPGKRQDVRDAVTDFVSTYGHPNNRYLVTSRSYTYQDLQWQLDRFAVHTLAPFNQKQIDDFIVCWYKEVCRLGWKSENEAEELTSRLQVATRRADLSPLARSPLQLTMMASLHFSWGRLPDDRVELYQEMIQLLLVRWQEARLGEKLGVPHTVSASQLESALEQVAFIAHRAQEAPEGTADVDEATLHRLLKDHLEGSWEQAAMLVKYIQERAGLLVERRPGLYTFPHRSYQEYLAGSYLAVQPDFPYEATSLVRENYDQWREVVLWSMGVTARLKKMIYIAVNVIAAMCPYEVPDQVLSETDWRIAHLAGEGLLEIGLEKLKVREQYGQVLARVTSWLVALIERGVLAPVERASTGSILSQLGDPRFRKDAWFLPDEVLLGFVEVPAGSFLMGTSELESMMLPERFGGGSEWYEAEMPQSEVVLPAYYIARYPVTVAQFRSFVEDTGFRVKEPHSLQGIDNHPVVDVSWFDALEYCRWLTERLREWAMTREPLATLLRENGWVVTLPSEAEWEKAARGSDGRLFPWGEGLDPSRANYVDTGIQSTSTVGGFPEGASPYGVMDLSGNVWEWTRSLWGRESKEPEFRYPYSPGTGRENLEADRNVRRVLRGGAFDNGAKYLRCAYRFRYFPDFRDWFIGFRVVISPDPHGANSLGSNSQHDL